MERGRCDNVIVLSITGVMVALGGCAIRASCQPLMTDERGGQQLTSTRLPSVEKEISLGNAYLKGDGVAKDEKLAAYWFEKAAEAGDPRAQQQIGFFYQAGIGVSADPERAVHWYQLASAGGLASAKMNLGVAYLWGVGVAVDAELAAQLFREAAGKGDGAAATYLGNLYHFGYGLSKDEVAAEHWYRVGAKLHDPVADYDLGTLYSAADDHAHDFAKAAEWQRKSVAGGYVPAIHALGLLVEQHPELARSDHEYLALFEKASGYGQWKSSEVLGILYVEGKLVPRDPKAAYYYFQLATLQGADAPKEAIAHVMQVLSAELGADQTSKLDAAAEAWHQQHRDRVEFLLKRLTGQSAAGLALDAPNQGIHAGQIVPAPFPPSS